MVTYLSPFICSLSTLTAPLWELLRKDAYFIWNASYEAAFQWVKQAIISNTTFRYFDPSLPVTIQVDASQVGLGTALLQDNKPIAFASKALTNAECRYANMEREMLAVVFGVERFCTYIYGWSFMIKSDHKPLESISRKNLAGTPAWLHAWCHACRDMTSQSITSQARKWSYQIHSPDSVSSHALTFHWILPSIMPVSTASIPSRNNEVTVACTWKFLLAWHQ